ncbi:MAG: lamin tail domain-containing protein, partial [Candidatus Moraniibacteriota bacterium]
MTARTAFSAYIKQSALLAISLGSAFFVLTEIAEAQENSWNVFIRTVQTSGDTTSEDFIEIRNDEDCALDLSGWNLRKRIGSGSESSVKVFGDTSNTLPPGATLLWANSANSFASTLHATESSTATLTDNNSLALLDTDDAIVDSLSWG